MCDVEQGAKDELFLEKVDDEPEEPFTGTVTFAKATKKAEGGVLRRSRGN